MDTPVLLHFLFRACFTECKIITCATVVFASHASFNENNPVSLFFFFSLFIFLSKASVKMIVGTFTAFFFYTFDTLLIDERSDIDYGVHDAQKPG